MLSMDAQSRDRITAVCRRYGVTRLRMFGSALTDRFDPQSSDVDLLVDFSDAERTFQALFDLRSELEHIVGYRVDLLDAGTVRNPYFARSVLDTARDLYAA